MFSIAAINDTESRNQWQPLAPTKEAQEFHLSQLYHDGLLSLQSKDYKKARELLELVLKDPLVSNAQVESASDGHILQLRFLALKNLATVFLQQGRSCYDKALCCYLQAVEIDGRDSVVWNQLGTLSCSMGSLSISRWAFEQGLICSPSNWNCMEKLLEVLIAIGDEVACLSVAKLILRHWPSHSRALHVKNTIEDSEPIPFTPRGIDKLEPKHIRLKFPEKRKATDEDLEMTTASKRMKQNIEIHLSEASWIALVGELVDILNSSPTSGDVRLSIQLPSSAVIGSTENKGFILPDGAARPFDNSEPVNEKEGTLFDEQPQERRSSRLERLRSRKPGKDDSYFSTSKDPAKVVKQFLVPYIMEGTRPANCPSNSDPSFHSAEVLSNSVDSESPDVIEFVQNTSNNFGAYHMGHLLLEKIANRSISYQDSITKVLDLEKVTRHWGLERSPECSLFLAELYYDMGLQSSETLMSNFISEASYHLCKIVESVALEYPFHITGVNGKIDYSVRDVSENDQKDNSSYLNNKNWFWIRFFWLSARLSLLEGDKEKAQKELSIVLALFTGKDKVNSPRGSICLPHSKIIKELTVDRVLHALNLIEVDYLLKNSISGMLEKSMHAECVKMLAPCLLSAKDVNVEVLCDLGREDKGNSSVELSALDVLIRSCEVAEPMDIDIYLNCHRRKLSILLAGAVLESKSPQNTPGLNTSLESQPKESLWKHYNHLVAEEVKAISRSASQIKGIINSSENSKKIPLAVIGDIQSLLLTYMCNVATCFSKKSSGIGVLESTEQPEQCCFVEAAIAFFKLEHLDINVTIKSLAELVVAIHDMLAEFGICCARGNCEEQDETFLKLAIKHLLALDMKLKSTNSLNKGEQTKFDRQTSKNVQLNIESRLVMLDKEVGKIHKDESKSAEKNVSGSTSAENFSSVLEKEQIDVKYDSDVGYVPDSMSSDEETVNSQNIACGNELNDDEREELELIIDNALDQCFYCLYGLNLRLDSSTEEELVKHKNTSQGDYQTKEQCADVFQYILPYARASSKTGMVKLRRVLRAIRKHFPKPPDRDLAGNPIEKFLDNPELCEDKLSEEAGSEGFLSTMRKIVFSEDEPPKHQNSSSLESSDPFLEVYQNLYYLLAQSEELSATDKWAGFVLTKEGEEFVDNNANLFKYDLIYNPLRFESWQSLANIYDEEVDLLLNDGSKQINVSGWRKSVSLPHRVESSRRRSRRCLLMTLALAKTATQQGEIHELLALVYYDGLQNVVPFYDQRSVVPLKDAAWKMFCQNSMSHFNKALKHKEDWSHAFYMGKLSEKLGYPDDTSFSYYAKAIIMNPSAVDPFYRMHASRLKLLCKCRTQNEEALKVAAAHSFAQSTKDTVTNLLSRLDCETPETLTHTKDGLSNSNSEVIALTKFEKAWNILYSDCLSALETCVEGDLKHFHKARYMLAQGYYRRGGTGDLEKAKEELSFCFKSSRSSFTINMWEIDSMVKKGRRKTPGPCHRRSLEVNLAESSRKFITCIRKYILFYLKLLEETGDNTTLERAYICLKADKRFSLCLEDLVPVALGRYIKALITSICQASSGSYTATDQVEHLLEKLFNLFLEQVNLWSDICNLPELKSPELTESSLYGYIYQYIQLLERNIKFETLEGINEKIRKRLKNPKLSNSNLCKVYKHVSAAWCRSLVISMVLITPLHSRISTEIHGMDSSSGGLEIEQLLCVDLQPEELWSSAFEDVNHLKALENKWNPSLSKIKNVIIKRVSDEDLETAATLLKSSYNFYKDTSCSLLPSGVNLYIVPAQLGTETYVQPGIEGIDILDMNTSRKLLLWAYSLLHGHYVNISHVIKHCEENVRLRIRKGTGGTSTPSNAQTPTNAASQMGGGAKDGIGKTSEAETVTLTPPSLPETQNLSETSKNTQREPSTLPENDNTQNSLQDCVAEKKGNGNIAKVPSAPLSPFGETNNSMKSALPKIDDDEASEV